MVYNEHIFRLVFSEAIPVSTRNTDLFVFYDMQQLAVSLVIVYVIGYAATQACCFHFFNN